MEQTSLLLNNIKHLDLSKKKKQNTKLTCRLNAHICLFLKHAHISLLNPEKLTLKNIDT